MWMTMEEGSNSTPWSRCESSTLGLQFHVKFGDFALGSQLDLGKLVRILGFCMNSSDSPPSTFFNRDETLHLRLRL
jgi:hypothetical protein